MSNIESDQENSKIPWNECHNMFIVFVFFISLYVFNKCLRPNQFDILWRLFEFSYYSAFNVLFNGMTSRHAMFNSL